ncbi:hypothetical protein [Streptomyces sp. V1I1]|uniref:hypothetical protein n=1 Tax=Streptomyces sp. V1I1 TaxID=3042272 RepID=UPI0027876A37|nr:hypothetical protein [Streptomyces sp. V1I1]MDQ0946001.1 hypothetical protein [Streptomyces sp. V1I1]
MHALTARPKPQQRTAAAIMRAIARRSPHLHTTPEPVCEREECFVAWAGEEADCWNCGMPATLRSNRRGSALQRLLAVVDSGAVRSAGHRKAAAA